MAVLTWARFLDHAGMAVLVLLDLVRVGLLERDLHMRALRPCKTEPALTCSSNLLFTNQPC